MKIIAANCRKENKGRKIKVQWAVNNKGIGLIYHYYGAKRYVQRGKKKKIKDRSHSFSF